MHPTVKPVALVADAVSDRTKLGEIVLDEEPDLPVPCRRRRHVSRSPGHVAFPRKWTLIEPGFAFDRGTSTYLPLNHKKWPTESPRVF
jgi:hypothetical protein